MIKLTLLGGATLSIIMLTSQDPLAQFVGVLILAISALGVLGTWHSRRSEQRKAQSHETWEETMNEYRGRTPKEGSIPPNQVLRKY
ncbi:MAG: hypothetical protein AAB478_00110 [Patescibacteria group bacterium]